MNPFHVQNQDVNIGPAYFNQLGLDKLLITRIFYTIQGEGPFAGHPAVFVRLAGCNRGEKTTMGCQFCDTFFKADSGLPMTFEQIHMIMLEVITIRDPLTHRDPKPLVVITGGEPMIQNNIVGFIEFLGRAGWAEIQIESNGDRLASGFLDSKWCETVSLVVSPKMTKNEYHDLKSSVFHRLNALKFVVDARPGVPYHFLPQYTWIKDPDLIFISPLTVYKRTVDDGEVASAWDATLIDQEKTNANYAFAAQLAMRFGFRTSMQQHLFFVLE